MAAVTGAPHRGHDAALSEIWFPHSEQAMRATDGTLDRIGHDVRHFRQSSAAPMPSSAALTRVSEVWV